MRTFDLGITAEEAHQVTFGVVLGGGGPLGSGWYAGLGQGLVEAGVDLGAVDAFIGTSAGAVAGAWWASGEPPAKFTESVIRRFEDPDTAAIADSISVDLDLVSRIYGLLGQATGPLDEDSSRAICELAGVVGPRGGDEDWNVKSSAPYLPADWPERFWAVVVRARDGKVRLLGADDSLPLARGVAASAAAPGLTNAVRIGRDLYFDGGARSATNADLAIRFHLDRCLVLSPVPSDAPFVGAATARVLEQEVRKLRCEGTAVAAMVPGDLEAAAFGWNLVDRSKVRDAIEAGLQRARRDGVTLSFR